VEQRISQDLKSGKACLLLVDGFFQNSLGKL
jgi:hypothetical protein